jgi:hypothetical protein
MADLPDAFAIYRAATGHWKSAARLGRAKKDKHYGLSMVVLESFSLELYLKCLHVVRGTIHTGHNTRQLFDKLAQADRENIRTAYGPDAPVTIEDVLSRSGEVFVKGRYPFDLPNKDWFELACKIPLNEGLSRLICAVREVILKAHPTWGDDYMALMGPTD